MSEILVNPPAPGSPEWRRMITASKIPAILGISRYKSQFALWHEMAGTIEPTPMDPRRAAWGHAAELAIAQQWAVLNPGWRLNPLRNGTHELAYRTDHGFPSLATLDRRAYKGGAFHLIECKTARDLNDWGREGEKDAVPADYFAQVIWQMGQSGIHEATIGVLGYGSGPEFHEVEWNPEMYALLVDAAARWYQSLIDGVEPELDGTTATYEAIRGLHPDIEKGTEVEIPQDMATDYLAAVAAEREAKTELTLQKSRMLKLMGNSHKAMCEGQKIADRRPTARGVAIYANAKADPYAIAS
ncbi:hypothetical protein BRL53_09095 [Corynebacterium ulcerans]|uniref:YqaJ viral recombinase family protein n=1 Tax=Corynebacterium ulcerans TaxID=65058 RepID=UPI000C778A3C|nr:YqaJ viral recombinase family protein [Corynebacterium ulcerans]PLV98775.1 hypothetical protein BRL53_09095 [Corynebacterium ulcerans]